MADEPQDKPVEEQAEETPEAAQEVPQEEVVGQPTEEVAPKQEAAPEAEAPVEAEPTPTATEEPIAPAVEEPKAAPKPVSANLEKIIEQIEKLSVLELADLVHALEERFGVTATAPVMAADAVPAAGAAEPGEEKTTFNVILSASGANKIAVIKAVRELVPTLGLKEAKDLVEAAPKSVLEGVNKETAEEAKTKLTAAGGTVELQ